MKYIVIDLSLEQVADIYNNYIHLHFPQDEIKPLKNIQKMWGVGSYRALGMYEQNDSEQQLIGYAFFAMAPGCNMLLLDYLAVVEEYRGQGMGGMFLTEMRERLNVYDGILIETEDIDFASNEEERLTRQNRDAFYEQNGVLRTGIKSQIYGVRFANWQLPVKKALTDGECRRNLEGIYKIMIPGEKNEKFVKIERVGGNIV